MAVIYRPGSKTKTARCVICHRARPFSGLTAGFWDAEGKQRFACDSHSLREVIVGWADFVAGQRLVWLERYDKGGNYESPLH